MSPSSMTSLIIFTRLQSYFRPRTADFTKSKYMYFFYCTPVFYIILFTHLGAQTSVSERKKILLTARDLERWWPLNVGGSHDRHGPLTAGGPCALHNLHNRYM